MRGVPSLHICQDFIPELLSQPDIYKQAFAVDLISHLSIQYAMPKAYNEARLAINAMSTLLSGKFCSHHQRELRLTFPFLLVFFSPVFRRAEYPVSSDIAGVPAVLQSLPAPHGGRGEPPGPVREDCGL